MTRTQNVDSDDYYQVLGLPRDASNGEVTKAFRKLALQYHPDKSQEDKGDAEVKFKQISEAYCTLQDPQKRKLYDSFGKCGMPRSTKGERFSVEEIDFLFGGFPSCQPGCSDKILGGLGKTLDLQQIFNAVNKGGSERKRQRKASADPSNPFALPPGKMVTVHGLTEAVQHNGKKAQVLCYDAETGRYDVKMRADGAVISVKPEKLTQHCAITIRGLAAQPRLNGCLADIVGFQPESGNYVAILRRGSRMISISPRNCTLVGGTYVKILGLPSGDKLDKLNGTMALVLEADVDAGCYCVKSCNGEEVRVKYDNVQC